MKGYLVYFDGPNGEDMGHRVFLDELKAAEYAVEYGGKMVGKEFSALSETIQWFNEHILDEIYPGYLFFMEIEIEE